MKLKKWAQGAEIASGIAVVISLVFLIFGIRENTEVTRAAVYGQLIGAINEQSQSIVENDELSRIWRTFLEGNAEQLNAGEEFRLGVILRTLWRNYETAYFSNQYGTIGSAEWDRFERGMCARSSLATPSQWESTREFLTMEFFSYLDDRCRKVIN